MVPFIDGSEPFISWGPLQIGAFNLLAITAILFGTFMMRKYTERYGMDEDDMRWLGIRLVVWGFIASHVFDVLFYEPHKLREDPLILLKVWEGIASYGGFLGGAIAFIVYTRLRGLHPLRWVDMVMYGFAPAMVFGRAACAAVHDHQGSASDFVLAIDFPAVYNEAGRLKWAEGPHHDLGFYEMLVWLGIWAIIFVLSRWEGRRPGTLLAAWALLYPPARFMLEFLRPETTDPRYLGLTPAQFLALGTFVFGVALLGWLYTRPGVSLMEPAKEAASVSAPAAGQKPKQSGKKGKKRKRR